MAGGVWRPGMQRSTPPDPKARAMAGTYCRLRRRRPTTWLSGVRVVFCPRSLDLGFRARGDTPRHWAIEQPERLARLPAAPKTRLF